MPDEELRQADLSHLRLADMTAEQKAEMRRRYVDFVRRLTPPAAPARPRKSGPAKWVPGKRAR